MLPLVLCTFLLMPSWPTISSCLIILLNNILGELEYFIILVLQDISEFATIVSIITEINQGAWPSFHTNVLPPHSLCYLFIYFYQRVYFAFEKKFRDLWDVGHDGHLYKCCSNHPSSRFCDSSSVSRIWNKNERNAPSQKVRAAAKGLENRSSS